MSRQFTNGDGRFELNQIRSVVEHNVQFRDVKDRIMCTDVLFIDVCSMMSANFLECLNEV
jgi:hypothetical protein